MTIVGLGASVGPLDSAVNISFPDITGTFGKPLGAIQWVIICYVLTYASLLLNFGRFADIAGHRRVFVGGLIATAAGLTTCGLAGSYEWLLAARVAQGVGTALVLATGPALVTLSFTDTLRPRALGGYAMFVTGAMAVGPVLGGVLVSRWGWPAVFWFRVPIAVVVAMLVLRFVPQPAIHPSHQTFDFAGAVALFLTLVCALLGFNRVSSLGWFAPSTVMLVMVALASLVAFIMIERRAINPVIQIKLFARRQFSIANVSNVLLQLAAFTVFLLSPFFLVRYTGDVAQAGLLLGVSPVGGAIAAAVGGRLLGRFSAWSLSSAGLTLVTVGLAGVSTWEAHSHIGYVIATLTVSGVGIGLFQVSNMDYVIGSVPRSQHGVAGALTMLTRTIGVVAGATLGSVLFTGFGGHFPTGAQLDADFIGPYGQVFKLASAVSAVALVAMLGAGRETRPGAHPARPA